MCQTKRETRLRVSLLSELFPTAGSAELGVVVARPVHKDGRVQQLATAGAFPGIEGTDEIVELLSKHAAFASWTLHNTLQIVRFQSCRHYLSSITASVPKKDCRSLHPIITNNKALYFSHLKYFFRRSNFFSPMPFT